VSRKFLNGLDTNIIGGVTPGIGDFTVGAFAPTVTTSGIQSALTVTGSADTNQTSGSEKIDSYFNLARTVQWATGALVTQRAVAITAPTYAFVGASTITTAATFAITGAPQPGLNATITNAYALWVQAGTSQFAGAVNCATTATVSGLLTLNGPSNNLLVSPSATTGTFNPMVSVTGAANTAVTASTEANDININLARIVQWATGALTTQRAFLVQAPTYAFVGASTITNAATFAITGAPAAGTNATLTHSYALWVQTGQSEFDGLLNATATATLSSTVTTSGVQTVWTVAGSNDTNQTASTEKISVNYNLSHTVQWATGAIATQREFVINAPTYAFVGASTITSAATLAIVNAPQLGTNASITNAYALWVQNGKTLLNGGLVVNSTTTLATTITGVLTVQPPVATGGAPGGITYTGAAHTTLAASTEDIDVYINAARTVQFATGAIALQRMMFISAPTYGFVAGSTITNAATVYIDRAPQAGTNATITNAYSLWVAAGGIRLDGPVGMGGQIPSATTALILPASTTGVSSLRIPQGVAPTVPVNGDMWVTSTSLNVQAGGTTLTFLNNGITGTLVNNQVVVGTGANTVDSDANFTWSGTALGVNGTFALAPQATTGTPTTGFLFTQPAHTALTASTEYNSIRLNGSVTQQFATGALATQRFIRIDAPVYSFVGASTITTAATLAIGGSPASSTNATIANSYALWVQSGATELDQGTITANQAALSITTTWNNAAVGFTAFSLYITDNGAASNSSAISVYSSGTQLFNLTLNGLGMAQFSRTWAGAGAPGAMLALIGTAQTTITAGTEVQDFLVGSNRTLNWNTGALTNQRFNWFRAPTMSFVAASTVTNAATVAIEGAPANGGNANFTNVWSLWVQAGDSCFDGNLVASGGFADQTINGSSWATTGNLTIPANTWGVINTNTGGIASFTLKMPANPISGQKIVLMSRSAVTTFTFSANIGQTILNAPTTLAANSCIRYTFYNAIWYREQ